MESVPVFRQFSNTEPDIFSNYKVRSLTAKVESYRELILDFYKDMDEELPLFNPPELTNIPELSFQARKWLNASEMNYSFSEWKEKLEEKGVFIFMTSRYKGWSYVDKELFRGLSIYHPILPIIIINDSDAFKAQSFTLFHELGHLIKKESAIDKWTDYDKNIEKWCDEFSGNLLMPEKPFKNSIENIEYLADVKKLANRFNISAYACLVRLRDLRIINQNKYYIFEKQLKDEYREIVKKMKESAGGPPRNRPEEIINQYGGIFSKVVFQAFHNQEIGLKKLCQLLELKNPKYALQIEGQL